MQSAFRNRRIMSKFFANIMLTFESGLKAANPAPFAIPSARSARRRCKAKSKNQ